MTDGAVGAFESSLRCVPTTQSYCCTRDRARRFASQASLETAFPSKAFCCAIIYLYEKNWRSFSFTEAVHYNPALQGFEFFQLTYGYEPIPTREHPTQDPIYHQSYHLVTVDESGHILLARSEPTGDRMFNREPSRFVQHEVAFQAFSLFTVHDDAVPRDAIWEEQFSHTR